MKKICTILLTLTMLCSVVITASAAERPFYPFHRELVNIDPEDFALEVLRNVYAMDYVSEKFPEYSAQNWSKDGPIRFSMYVSNCSEGNELELYNFSSIGKYGIASQTSSDDFYNKYQLQLDVEFGSEHRDYSQNHFFTDAVQKAKQYSNTARGQIEYINDFLVDYLDYDYDQCVGGYGKSVEDIIKSRKAVCSGYTNVVGIFCELLNIPCIIMHYTDVDPNKNHVWNYVYIDGEWKHLDVTWNDTADRRKYFLIDEICDVTSHDWHKSMNEQTLRFLEDANLFYNSINKEQLKAKVYKELDEIYAKADLTVDRVMNLGVYQSKVWNLIPDDLYCNYEDPVTRENFCRILVQTIEKICEKPIGEILQSKGVAKKQISFSDTNNPGVIALAKLGIISGTGNNFFDTNGYVNRAQAAVIVKRVAEKVFDVDTSQIKLDFNKSDFRDKDILINSWYKDEIIWALATRIVISQSLNCYTPEQLNSNKEAMIIADKLYYIFKN